MFDSPRNILSFSFLNYQFALALWDKLACLLNQTCPVAAQGGSGTGVSVSIHSPPPHLSFQLIWCDSLVRRGAQVARFQSTRGQCTAGACCQGTTAVEKQISFEPPRGEIKRPVSVLGGAPNLSRLCGEASVMSGVIIKQLHTHGTVVAREGKYVRARL